MRTFVFSLAFIFLSVYGMAQGCSDAGFCSAGAMQASRGLQKDSVTNIIALSLTAGQGETAYGTGEEYPTYVFIPQLEYSRSIGKKGVIEIKLPYFFASGYYGRNSGIGDPIISYTHTIFQKPGKFLLSGTLGTRVSLGHADVTGDTNFILPMTYQNHLGTTDIIFGLSTKWKYVSLALGYQQPLLQYNENTYEHSWIEETSYVSSRKLERAPDLLFRFELHRQFGRIGIAAGPLFIWHLGMDKIEIPTKVSVKGSEGLTLNLSGDISYTARKWMADISAGMPIAARQVRPDGLTREWVVTPRISYMLH